MPEPAQRVARAHYTDLEGNEFAVEYDPDAPCWMCGLPVVSASMGGTVVCSWCDCGQTREGRQWTLEETNQAFARFRENRERAEAAHERELERQAELALEPGPRARPSELAERAAAARPTANS